MQTWQETTKIRCPRILSVFMLLGISSPLALAWGPGELFVTNYKDNSVTVYARTASGTAVARRTIRTGLIHPFGVLVDPLHNEVIIANNTSASTLDGSLQVYDLNANYPSDVPKRTLAGPATGLYNCTGMAIDALRNELYVSNDAANTIVVFPRTAHGNVAPSRAIQGPTTNLSSPQSLVIDLLHDELIVANNVFYLGGQGRVTVYHRNANGDAAPIRTIEGSNTGFSGPVGLDLDVLHDEIVVTNANANSLATFHRNANGNVAPLRSIAGPTTHLCVPYGVVVDFINNEIVVANSGYQDTGCRQSAAAFSRTANGDQSPTRILDMGPGDSAPYPVELTETLLSIL